MQTNYDRDQPEPIYDQRRHPAESRLRDRGNLNFNETDVMKVMFEWPTFNIATIMTAVMTPKDNYHNTTVWYGYNPKVN